MSPPSLAQPGAVRPARGRSVVVAGRRGRLPDLPLRTVAGAALRDVERLAYLLQRLVEVVHGGAAMAGVLGPRGLEMVPRDLQLHLGGEELVVAGGAHGRGGCEHEEDGDAEDRHRRGPIIAVGTGPGAI